MSTSLLPPSTWTPPTTEAPAPTPKGKARLGSSGAAGVNTALVAAAGVLGAVLVAASVAIVVVVRKRKGEGGSNRIIDDFGSSPIFSSGRPKGGGEEEGQRNEDADRLALPGWGSSRGSCRSGLQVVNDTLGSIRV